ncbi:hypothetical protein [Ectopseudomonas guguanensis]|jgi:hypothetical protein|uniref:Lipoprotein n=1 Tax=Ectopseudomonas guguanensis TaxID=1198456 RepID=A0A1H0U1F6_9GAMM|nr:hypothetical protein [Pseudomonas guguanensis]SDP60013.1 hypothetical protein SAMN05216213_104339 [Pseudomonas guguanensis]
MRLLPLLLLGALLGGCASTPNNDPSGTWINQAAIDAARESGRLREALLAYGPNLEWHIDPERQQASYSNGFELAEGRLQSAGEGRWQVTFYGDYKEQLSIQNGELVQVASGYWPEQHFTRFQGSGEAKPLGSSFEQALYRDYLGGDWLIEEGLGQGGLVRFNSDGQVQGLPGAERFALCLAGDCAAMSGEHDSIWLQAGDQGSPWLFVHEGNRLRIFEAQNRAQFDEMPEYQPGPQRWLLKRR